MRRQMGKLMLIDGQNLAYRAKYKFNLSTPGGLDSGVFYGFIYILNSMLKRFPSDEVFTVFDGGRSVHRMALLPGYKAREDKLGTDRESFYNQLHDLEEALPALNVSVLKEKGEEADDLIALIAKASTEEVLIISADKDFAQLISSRVSIYNPFKDVIITPDNCYEVYGFEPGEIVDWLSLLGDKSDKIPGVAGMGPKRIRAFLDDYETVEDYLDEEEMAIDYSPYSKYPISEVYHLNYKLIDLGYYLRKHYRGKTVSPTYGKWDEEKFLTFVKKYRTGSFIRKDFLKQFREL